MYTYGAYGLGIHSALPLPELPALVGVNADVVIQLGKIDWFSAKPNTETYFHVTIKEAYFFWNEVGAFLVRNGKEIIIDPRPGVEERVIRLPLLGAVLAVLLHQRGFLVLHASAVKVDGSAVAFLGEKGQGKSTMAATLYARGHSLIADDVVALDINNTISPILLPGFPQVKLWPDAASSIGDDPEVLPQLHPQIEKRARYVIDRFSNTPCPLKQICVLSKGAAPQLKPLQVQEAIVQLISNSYMARFGKQMLHGTQASLHLHQCTRLLNSVPVYRLERPHSLPLLPAAAQLVEEELSQKR